jgi:hypothetical protein
LNSKREPTQKSGVTPLFYYVQGVLLPQCVGMSPPLFMAEKGRECRYPMAEANLVRHKPSMAGTLSAVAYSMEVRLDRCTVRLITKEGRYSTQYPVKHPERKCETMPIKWSALRVSEAMDMVEGFVNQAVEPLEQTKIVPNFTL